MKKLFSFKLIILFLLVVTISVVLGACNIGGGGGVANTSKSHGFIKNSTQPNKSIYIDVVDVEKLDAINSEKAEYDLSTYLDAKQVIKRIQKSVVSVCATNQNGVNEYGSGVIIACTMDKNSENSAIDQTEDNANYTSYLITSHQVISQAVGVTVTTFDGSIFEAYLVGSDPDSDICVMSVNKKLEPVEFYTDTATLELGESVLSIGYPLKNKTPMVTGGILSICPKTYNIANSETSLLFTDAVGFNASTGGGLFTSTGLFIGMSDYYMMQNFSEISGLMACVDANMVIDIATGLVNSSTSQTPGYISGKYYLGFGVTNVVANRWGTQSYVAIDSLDQGGSFYKSGLRINDELQSFTYNGTTYTISKAEDFTREIESIKFEIGDVITFRIVRNSTMATIDVTIMQYIYGVS